MLRNFIGPFMLTFMITLFIFVMQFLWKYIDDLVGKGLEMSIVGKLIFLASASFVPLALPLAVLLSSIMTYGDLGEHFELVAMRASGISLYRYMRPMFLGVVFIAISAFGFSNYVLPKANLKFGSLLSDIRNQKPALNIKAGTFYNGIDGFSIRVGSKGEDNKTIHDIIIYDHTSGRGNDNVLIAESGEMLMSADERYLILKMRNGRRYAQSKPMGDTGDKFEHMSTEFAEWEKWFDLAQFDFEQRDESFWSDHYKMMNLSQLESSIDTIRMEMNDRQKDFKKNLSPYFTFIEAESTPEVDSLADSSAVAPVDTSTEIAAPIVLNDSLRGVIEAKLAPESETDKELLVLGRALSNARNIKSFAGVAERFLDFRQKTIRKHEIEWHRKITLSFACLVMFLIGAPLGSIIRKGGFGLPLFISIILFLVFHVLNMIGENVSEEGKWSAFTGMWLATGVLFPFGLFVSYKAMMEAPLIDINWIYNIGKKKDKQA